MALLAIIGNACIFCHYTAVSLYIRYYYYAMSQLAELSLCEGPVSDDVSSMGELHGHERCSEKHDLRIDESKYLFKSVEAWKCAGMGMYCN